MLVAERYRLVEELGRGAMGEVWRAEDTTLGREVAVKLLLKHVTMDRAADRFRQEAQTAARLNHPNLVAVYDFDEEEGRGYLVMELVPGRSLRDELAAGDVLGIDEVRRIAGQAAAGLDAAHSRGVVHRDIKPGNLLLAPDGKVKVADFGIARAAMESDSSLTATGAVLGTSIYLAPERATGRHAEPASDVYALGCVLYEMLCGGPPFTGDPAAVVYQHVEQAPQQPAELRPDVPPALADFLLRLLAKDPTARPTAAQAAHFLTGDTASAGAPPAPRAGTAEPPTARSTHALPATPATRRSRRSVVLASVAAASVFILAGVLGFQLDSGPGTGSRPATKPSISQPGRPETRGSGSATTPPAHHAPGNGGPQGGQARKAPEKDPKRQATKHAADDARKPAQENGKLPGKPGKKPPEGPKKP